MGFFDIIKGAGKAWFSATPTGYLYGKYGESEDQAKKQADAAAQQRAQLDQAATASGAFAGQGEQAFGQLGQEAAGDRAMLRDQATGKVSLSAEQLRQGLQQNIAGQRAMAASAMPGSQPMAARTAMMNAGRLGSAAAGAQAQAGIAERMQAAGMLNQATLGARGQDLSAALGGRGNQIGANQAGLNAPQEKTWLEKYGPMLAQGAGIVASDERLKKGAKRADKGSKDILEGLQSYTFKYKDGRKHGEGEQFGVMAQDMEKAGLGHAVIDTPGGKMVHGGKAATTALGLTAALAKRVSKLEGKGRGGR